MMAQGKTHATVTVESWLCASGHRNLVVELNSMEHTGAQCNRGHHCFHTPNQLLLVGVALGCGRVGDAAGAANRTSCPASNG